MINLKVGAVIRNRKTYQIGLLQDKAYRILKSHTGSVLQSENISTTEWAFLGLLYDQKEAIRANSVAESLGVKAPFVTVFIKKFTRNGFLVTKEGAKDSRIKLLSLTNAGKDFVVHTERLVREKMRPMVHGARLSDLAGYVAILESIIENTAKKT